jgi:isocitrate dehydrogenase
MFSLHVKATMMKVSHPIVFGHCVRTFYKEAFEKHGKLFDELGVNVNNGMANLYDKIATLPQSQQDEIKRDLHACLEHRPALAMVDSAKGITNFHSPNDVIVDASMPAMIRRRQDVRRRRPPEGSQGRDPESTFARIYQEIINFCKWHGNFDPKTMGTVPNVGLMAQQAEEYGSHDKTFEVPEDGVANITDLATGEVLLSQTWSRATSGACARSRTPRSATGSSWPSRAPAIPACRRCSGSTLPPARSRDAQEGQKYLKDHDTKGLDIQVMSQVRAMRYTLERVIRGKDTISVTGNILRDYLTDLFPIMELGTSAKMLSIVPLMAGGGMYETGAGGSAPKHVQQLVEENHLRWDSLGEFLALAVSLEDLGIKTGNAQGQGAGHDAGHRHRQAAGQQQGPVAQDRPAGQPRQPVLPGAVLGAGAGRADRRRRRWRSSRRWPRRWPTTRRRSSTNCGRAGQAGRHRRLLPGRPGQVRGGDAPERDAERGAGNGTVSVGGDCKK